MKKFSKLNESINFGNYQEEDIKNHIKNSLKGYLITESIWTLDELDSKGDVYSCWLKDNLKYDGQSYYLEVDHSYNLHDIPDMDITYFQLSFNFRIEDLNKYEKYNPFNTTSEIFCHEDDFLGYPLGYFKKKILDIETTFEKYMDDFDVLIDCGNFNSIPKDNTRADLKVINIRMLTKDPILGSKLMKMISLK